MILVTTEQVPGRHIEKSLGEVRGNMIEQARTQGADAVLGVRFITAQISTGSAELLAFGIAVKLRARDAAED